MISIKKNKQVESVNSIMNMHAFLSQNLNNVNSFTNNTQTTESINRLNKNKSLKNRTLLPKDTFKFSKENFELNKESPKTSKTNIKGIIYNIKNINSQISMQNTKNKTSTIPSLRLGKFNKESAKKISSQNNPKVTKEDLDVQWKSMVNDKQIVEKGTPIAKFKIKNNDIDTIKKRSKYIKKKRLNEPLMKSRLTKRGASLDLKLENDGKYYVIDRGTAKKFPVPENGEFKAPHNLYVNYQIKSGSLKDGDTMIKYLPLKKLLQNKLKK